MGIKSSLKTLLSYSKFIPITLSFLWLLLVIRYLDIKPQYPTREYLKLLNNGSKNNGIVRMNTVHVLNKYEQNHENSNNLIDYFNHFNLLHLAQGKNKITCDTNIRSLVINANFKQIGDNYLALYKQIQKQNIYCRYSIYELNRKNHLLMNSQFLITNYAIEVAMTIQYFVNNGQSGHLNLITFQEGCSILFKAFQLLPNLVLEKIGAVILINAFNFNLQINYENPSIFFKNTFDRIQQNPQKVHILNQTRLIFISTTNFWESSRYQLQDQSKFNFLINEKKLHKTIFLNTRFMRNIYSLLHEKDYFSMSQLPVRIAKFLSLEALRKRRIQQIDYFFNYGELYSKIDYQFKNNKIKICGKSKLNNKLAKVTKVIQTMCVIFEISKRIKQSNQTILIMTSKNTKIYDDKSQKIQPIYERNQLLYYIFQRAKNVEDIYILNSQPNQTVYIEFHNPHGPISNPLPNQFFLKLNPYSLSNKGSKTILQQRKLIKTCPNGQFLIFPQHFYYNSNSLITSLTILNLNKIMFDLLKFQQSISKQDCYSDFFTQTYFLPSEIIKNWPFERNLIFLIVLCSYARRQSILAKTFLYIVILTFYRLFLVEKTVILLDFLLLSLGVMIQFFIKIISQLAKIIQQIIDIKYRKFMILITLAIALAKILHNDNIYIHQLSAWKLLCICLIFVINRTNALILLCKLYFLTDHIVYNHNDCLEIFVVLLWLFVTQKPQQIQEDKNESDTKNDKNEKNNKNSTKIKQQNQSPYQYNNQSQMPQTLLVILISFFINGSSQYLNRIFSAYIIFKSLTYLFRHPPVNPQKQK